MSNPLEILRFAGHTQTANDTPVTLISFDAEAAYTGTAGLTCIAYVTAIRTDESGHYCKAAGFHVQSGSLIQNGTTQDIINPDIESDGTWDATINDDGAGSIQVVVTGDASNNTEWTGLLEIYVSEV